MKNASVGRKFIPFFTSSLIQLVNQFLSSRLNTIANCFKIICQISTTKQQIAYRKIATKNKVLK